MVSRWRDGGDFDYWHSTLWGKPSIRLWVQLSRAEFWLFWYRWVGTDWSLRLNEGMQSSNVVCPLNVNNRGTSPPAFSSQSSPELWAQRCLPHFTLFAVLGSICQKMATARALIEEQPKSKTYVTQNKQGITKRIWWCGEDKQTCSQRQMTVWKILGQLLNVWIKHVCGCLCVQFQGQVRVC